MWKTGLLPLAPLTTLRCRPLCKELHYWHHPLFYLGIFIAPARKPLGNHRLGTNKGGASKERDPSYAGMRLSATVRASLSQRYMNGLPITKELNASLPPTQPEQHAALAPSLLNTISGHYRRIHRLQHQNMGPGAHWLNKINKDLCALANLLNIVDAKSGLYVTGVNQLLPQGPQALGQETSRI